jgi:MFS family permease
MTVLAGAPHVVEPARRGGLLRHRDFRRFWIGQTTSKLGSSVTSVALPLVAVATLGASTFQVALLAAATWLPWLVVGLPAGAWVDRLPRRPVMVTCDLVSLVLFVSVPVAWWSGVLTIGHLLAVALLTGTAGVFFQTAYQVYLPSLLDRDQVAEGNAKLQSSEAAAQVAGPGLGGLIAQLFGAVAGLLADAASFLVSTACLLSIRGREPRRAGSARRATLRREIGEGLRFVARDPYLRVLTVFGAASNLALIGYQAILVVFLVRVVGLRPGTVGVLVAATSLGAVIGAAAATRVARRFGSGRGLLLCEIACAPFGLLIPLTQPGLRLALLVLGGGVVAAGVSAGNVIKGSFRQTYTPRHLLGRVTVSMQLLNYGTIPVGALLGGALGAAIGLRPTMWITMSGVVLATFTLLVGPIRRRRDLPSHPVQENPSSGELPLSAISQSDV